VTWELFGDVSVYGSVVEGQEEFEDEAENWLVTAYSLG
jgi:hypothetical protein